MARHSEKPTDETIKETLESIVIAFILAFVFRAYVVEAFVIPTGSMAPTLLGEHIDVRCAQCGYAFKTDTPTRREEGPGVTETQHAVCPMCHFPQPVLRGTRVSAGDRILVHKYIYTIRDPQRWDVVVFKNPQKPDDNFIKRLVGLPEERLWIIEGNVYTQPLSADAAPWRIARKGDRPKVQRAVWQPIYHSDYVPLDGGRPSLERHIAGYTFTWEPPWAPQQGQWDVQGRSYRYDSTEPGRIGFDFERAGRGLPHWYVYNQFPPASLDPEPIEDVRVAATFLPEAPGLEVTLQTTARLRVRSDQSDAQPYVLMARIDAQGAARLVALDPETGAETLLRERQGRPLPPGRGTAVELWFVDQQATLWVEDQRWLAWEFEVPIESLKARDPLPPTHTPRIAIRVAGAPVQLHHVQVDRDLYYSSLTISSVKQGLGTLFKNYRLGTREGEPLLIAADQFYCLGDNSPRSSDSRLWTSLDPWIARNMFADNPDQFGVVPRKLMMGRAFFVYFPAMHAVSPFGLVPNFAEMRFIH